MTRQLGEAMNEKVSFGLRSKSEVKDAWKSFVEAPFPPSAREHVQPRRPQFQKIVPYDPSVGIAFLGLCC